MAGWCRGGGPLHRSLPGCLSAPPTRAACWCWGRRDRLAGPGLCQKAEKRSPRLCRRARRSPGSAAEPGSSRPVRAAGRRSVLPGRLRRGAPADRSAAAPAELPRSRPPSPRTRRGSRHGPPHHRLAAAAVHRAALPGRRRLTNIPASLRTAPAGSRLATPVELAATAT